MPVSICSTLKLIRYYKFGPIALAFTLLMICGLPVYGQQSSVSINRAFLPTPTPQPMPTASPEMAGMKSRDASTQDTGMGDDMMGAAGLVPPGIMIGKAGRWMVGYQVMFDKMDGNLVGTKRITNAGVLQRFMATPTDMTMRMHMGMLMYAPTDRLTLMVMLPYIRKSMNHITRTGELFTERTSGIGDVELRGLYSLYARKDLRHRFLLNAGMGLPTGSINQSMAGMRLEYPMQLGSGTVSVMPGFTYLGQSVPWGWGAEFIPTLRIGRNKNGYRLGNRYQTGVWGARQLTPWLSISARASGDVWQNVRGADAVLDIMDEPTKDPTLQGGKRIDLTFGASFHPTGELLKGQEFFVHFNKPVYQSLDGPQLQRRWVVRLGWQWEF